MLLAADACGPGASFPTTLLPVSTKQQRLQNQDALAQALPAAAAQLNQIAGVVRWGVGLKEVGGVLTEQFCFRVYVQLEKTDPVVNGVPASVQGYPVEVVQIYLVPTPPTENPTGEETKRSDEKEYRPVQGGICLSTKSVTLENKEGPTAGTFGWFAKKLSDNSLLALTNAHVLFPNLTDSSLSDEPLTGPDPLGQPIYDKTCCCEYHVCGERIIGIKSTEVDCGIASLNADAGTPALIIGNSSTNVTLRVDGKAKAAIGDKVRKIGKRSGYTEGIVIDVGDLPKGTLISTPTTPGGTRHGTIETRVHKILIWPTIRPGFAPYFDEMAPSQVAFMNEGDSGSAVIDEDNNILGLVYTRDPWGSNRSVGIACHIDAVLDKLNAGLTKKNFGYQIEIAKSPPAGGNVSGIATGAAVLPQPQTLRDLVRESAALPAVLYRQHRDEVTRLIERCRPATVAWHRHQGPAFAAAVNRSHREPAYRIPREINGVSRQALLIAMARVLEDHGSAALQRDIGEHAFVLIDELSRAENVRALLFPAPALELEAATQS